MAKGNTPEGKVKQAVKDVIKAFKPYVYAHWPVLNGMGTPSLDCIGCCNGLYFAVECKRDEKQKLTPRQTITRDEIITAGGHVFEIKSCDDIVLLEFENWLHHEVMQLIARRQRLNMEG